MPLPPNVPTAADVARIAAEQDPVLRNVLITQAYHDLAIGARQHLGTGANWCAFGTWASRQAGRTIRGEDLDVVLRARLSASPEMRRLATAVIAAGGTNTALSTAAGLVNAVARAIELDGVVDRAAAAVAAGNRKVFEDIASRFAAFLEVVGTDEPGGVDRFLDGLRSGDPPAGEARLRDAFQAYIDALSATSAADRAQLMHLGNLLIAIHEQVRVQPEIEAAMNCAFDQQAVRDRLLTLLLPGTWRRLRYRVAALFKRRPPLDDALDRLLAGVQRELRQLVTANAMTLYLPGAGDIHLARGLAGDHAPSLSAVTEARLIELLQRLDRAPDTVAGSGSTDWSILEQRLHLVADLFRCYHDAAELYDPPFNAAQVASLRAGRLPQPPL